LISFPNAKINLGLNITEKRPDGYHNLESCFYPIAWSDILEITPSKQLNFTSSGIMIPGDNNQNLCLKAYRLLNEDHSISPVDIHLHKNIPIGAGLGGGSSDGAFALIMLNTMFSLELSIEQLEEYASVLGSDCPFFVRNEVMFVTGTGNHFSPIDLDLSGKHIVIIKPDIHISTSEAYVGIVPTPSAINIKEEIEDQAIFHWKKNLSNDFEKSIFPNYPNIKKIKESLYKKGALYASMTGSGAAVFGIFESEIKIEEKNHAIWTSKL
jgi:4-diphosphocytidyl-2-C-methyl-D-erythritol kinase